MKIVSVAIVLLSGSIAFAKPSMIAGPGIGFGFNQDGKRYSLLFGFGSALEEQDPWYVLFHGGGFHPEKDASFVTELKESSKDTGVYYRRDFEAQGQWAVSNYFGILQSIFPVRTNSSVASIAGYTYSFGLAVQKYFIPFEGWRLSFNQAT